MHEDILRLKILLPNTELVLCEGGSVKSLDLASTLNSLYKINAAYLPGGIHRINQHAVKREDRNLISDILEQFINITAIISTDDCSANYPYAWQIFACLPKEKFVMVGAKWKAENLILSRYKQS